MPIPSFDNQFNIHYDFTPQRGHAQISGIIILRRADVKIEPITINSELMAQLHQLCQKMLEAKESHIEEHGLQSLDIDVSEQKIQKVKVSHERGVAREVSAQELQELNRAITPQMLSVFQALADRSSSVPMITSLSEKRQEEKVHQYSFVRYAINDLPHIETISLESSREKEFIQLIKNFQDSLHKKRTEERLIAQRKGDRKEYTVKEQKVEKQKEESDLEQILEKAKELGWSEQPEVKNFDAKIAKFKDFINNILP